MFEIFKKDTEDKDKKQEKEILTELKKDVNSTRILILERELERQKIVNKELLDLITMVSEHKKYDLLRVKITKIQNLLDKK